MTTMPRTVAPPTRTAAGPFAALLAQARRAPQAEALRSRRRGQWRAHTWQRLAAQADLAARGWAALGVLPGDRIVALGPLGADLIVTLFAADALGATVVLAHDAAEPEVIGDARFAFADGTHELERLLRHRGPLLRAAVVGDAAVVPPSGRVDRVPLYGTAQLFAAGCAHATLPTNAGRSAIAQVVGRDGAVHTLGTPESAGPELGFADRVFADFSPTWPAGLGFVLHAWPATAPLLLIPEPHGDAVTDRREARANIWLAPPERLEAMAASLNARVPSRGLGARVARAVLAGRRSVPGASASGASASGASASGASAFCASVLGAPARSRIRAAMGLAATRRTVSDAAVAEPTGRLLSALGITPAPCPAVPAAAVARNPAAGTNAPGQAFDRPLVATP